MHEALITIADTKISLTQERLSDTHDDVAMYERRVAEATDRLQKARLEVTRLNNELDSLWTSRQFLIDNDTKVPEGTEDALWREQIG